MRLAVFPQLASHDMVLSKAEAPSDLCLEETLWLGHGAQADREKVDVKRLIRRRELMMEQQRARRDTYKVTSLGLRDRHSCNKSMNVFFGTSQNYALESTQELTGMWIGVDLIHCGGKVQWSTHLREQSDGFFKNLNIHLP